MAGAGGSGDPYNHPVNSPAQGAPSRWKKRSSVFVAFAIGSFLWSALINSKASTVWLEKLNADRSLLDYSTPCILANVPCSSHGMCTSCSYGLEKLADSNMSAFNYSTPISLGGSNTFLYRILGPRSATQDHVYLGTEICCLPPIVLNIASLDLLSFEFTAKSVEAAYRSVAKESGCENILLQAITTLEVRMSGQCFCGFSSKDPVGQGSNVLVKVSCLPFFKHSYITFRWTPKFFKPLLKKFERGQVYRDWLGFPCKAAFTGDLNKRDVALWNLANKCNVGHLMEEVRMGRVRGKMPETGYELNSEALFMKEAKGLTLRYFTEMVEDPDLQEDFFARRLNSSQVVEAAVFDLFTRQEDRHHENIFVNEKGDIKLIDNNKCMGEILDSLFLPSTRRHTASITGKVYTRTQSPQSLLQNPSLAARMDYRCHSNGTIGWDYPPGLLQCMRDISSLSVEEIMLDLDLDDRSLAANLKQSGTDMLYMGFEWTLYNGGPKRNGGGGYFPQLPCCKIVTSNKGGLQSLNKFTCGEGWNLTAIHHSFHYTNM